jgi:hypothetical protein
MILKICKKTTITKNLIPTPFFSYFYFDPNDKCGLKLKKMSFFNAVTKWVKENSTFL